MLGLKRLFMSLSLRQNFISHGRIFILHFGNCIYIISHVSSYFVQFDFSLDICQNEVKDFGLVCAWI